MRLVVCLFADERLQLVVDATRFARVAGRWLQRNGRRTMRWHLEIEGIRIGSEFLDKALLQSGQRSVELDLRVHLLVGQIQILAKRQAQHV